MPPPGERCPGCGRRLERTYSGEPVCRCADDGGTRQPAAAALEPASKIDPPSGGWLLRGLTSHSRYLTSAERRALAVREPPLARPGATRAALIPVRKSAVWWVLAQDERRAILEERSRHIATGARYLPAIARRLLHGRDLGEPFDFLTWFEYGPADADAFEELVGRVRQSEEWSYVEAEVDVRLAR